jgi:hypothetical protein
MPEQGMEPLFEGSDPRVTAVREPSCIHSNGTQPMNACRICQDSPVLAAWRDYWAKRNAE